MGIMARPAKTVTLTSIAKLAGVSVSTVSKALSPGLDTCDLNPQTRARICSVAEQLGYRLDWRARELHQLRPREIALVRNLPYPHLPAVFVDLPKHMMRTATARSCNLLVLGLGEPERLIQRLKRLSIDGLLLLDPIEPQVVAMLTDFRIPCVLVNVRMEVPLPQVLADEAKGTRLATEYLVALGHRRIGWVIGNRWRLKPYAAERYRAFRLALGPATEVGSLAYVEPDECVPWLRQHRPSAIIAYDGVAAQLVLRAAIHLGLSVPRELSLISCDDQPELAQAAVPITAVEVPFTAMARRSIELIADALDQRAMPVASVHLVDEELVIRASTGPVPGS